jgi:Icc-related predicted phosphoesterase
MKILAIGDPHGDLDKIKKIPLKGVDVILLTGDIGKADLARKRFFENLERKKKRLKEVPYDAEYSMKVVVEIYNSTMELLKYLLRYALVYAIAGNTWKDDSQVKSEEKKFGTKLPHLHENFKKMNNFHLVKNSLRTIGGVRIGFLEYYQDVSWTKESKPYNYNKLMKVAKRETSRAERVLEKFGDNLDILICHQPPYGVLDVINYPSSPHNRLHGGSKVILNYIKKHQPRYVFCGHIHESEGMEKIGKTEVYNLGLAGHKTIKIK